MASATAHSKATQSLIQAALRGALTEAQARRLTNENSEVLALALLAASKRIAELQGSSQGQPPSPSTPSGMVPIYTKPNTTKRRKKPGARQGHPGRRRKAPACIDKQPKGLSFFERYLTIWVGCLQFVLGRGQRLDWFSSNLIVTLTVVLIPVFAAFIIRELSAEDPIVDLRILKNRTFALDAIYTQYAAHHIN